MQLKRLHCCSDELAIVCFASGNRDCNWALMRVHSPHRRSCLSSVNSWQTRQTCLLIVLRLKKLTVGTRSLLSERYVVSTIQEDLTINPGAVSGSREESVPYAR